MSGDRDAFEAIVREVEHDGLSFDMRCFLVPHASGLVLIDTGLPGNVGLIAAGLERTGARWTDVTDVVLTHGHFDHVASLGDVVALTADAVVWAGEEDIAQIGLPGPVRALGDGDRVRDLRVMATPGHTPGHRSLVHEGAGLLFTGDVLGTMGGVLGRAPAQYTADAVLAERTLRRLAETDWGRMVFSHGGEVADPDGDLRRLIADGGSSAD